MGLGSGAAGGGGGMLKTFEKAVTATATSLRHRKRPMSLPAPLSSVSASSTTAAAVSDHSHPKASVLAVSSSGSTFDPLNLPLSPTSGRAFQSGGDSVVLRCEEFDWVTVDKGDAGVLMSDDAPGVDEVQDAYSALQLCGIRMLNADTNADAEEQVLRSVSERSVVSDGSELVDWTEPPSQLCNARLLQLQPYMHDRLFDAFHLLHTDPAIQRIVVSLASDRAVCDAVMNNEVVRELITNIEYDNENSDETRKDSSSAADFIKRLFERSAAKILDAMESITKYVTDLFKIPGDEAATMVVVTGAAPVMEKLQMTVLLTVIVLLIVLVTRATRA